MNLELYVIIDKNLAGKRDVVEVASEVIKGGAKVIQLRAKDVSAKDFLKLGLDLRVLTKDSDVNFIINDRVDVALACEADGVHLGQDDFLIRGARDLMGEKIIGISTHTIEQALEAEKEGADYISIGPVFSTDLKPGYPPTGLELIQRIRSTIHIPFVAIGGINLENVSQAILSGADNIACAQAVMKAPDTEKATEAILERIREAKSRR